MSVSVDESIREPARNYLRQALDSLHAPDGAVILAASAVDAMLKAIGYTKGTLYERINEATKNHRITDEMAAWAHEVRLDANLPRHSDENAPLFTTEDAKKAIRFAEALGEYLFVLPAKVERWSKNKPDAPSS